jgi:aspartate/methionine/tyrosine aminotransferase
MQIKPFKLERFFAQHEFSVDYLLSASDCESLSLAELLDRADLDGRQLWERLGLGYTESQGSPVLREEIAQLYQEITPADLLVAAPAEAIFLTMNCLLRPGDHLIATFPAYQSLYEVAQALDCPVTRWELTPCDGRWELDLDFLRANIKDRTKLIIVNFPHNPTGYLPSRESLEALIEIARQRDIALFSDEMYWRLEHRVDAQLPAICDRYEKGISLFGMSKTFALPGLRIGWLATRDREILNKLGAMKDYTTLCSSAPSEVLALIALRDREALIARSRQIIRDNLRTAREFFAAHEKLFTWLEPQGGSIAFPKFSADMPVTQFCEDVLVDKSVLIVPGTLFDYPGHFRLGLGRSNFAEAIEQVDAFIHESKLA